VNQTALAAAGRMRQMVAWKESVTYSRPCLSKARSLISTGTGGANAEVYTGKNGAGRRSARRS